VKKAAALANMEMGLLDHEIGEAIRTAASEVRAGQWDDQFLVDCIQGGAGTSVNMNANEVIANRALEIMGRERGDYGFIHPNNHVNLSQSTNDVYPTALRLTLVSLCAKLSVVMGELCDELKAKGEEFKDVVKMGRTQLQDAVPITLGQEFSAWAHTLGEDMQRLDEAKRLLFEVNIGATAIGTGITTMEGYAELVCGKLADITGLPLTLSPNLIEATSDTGAYVMLSGILKRLAVKLSKIASDLRLLSSGPYSGFCEIRLPAVQPGSSIMPGKVNPVIPEVVNQVCFQVISNDLAVTLAAEAGQLELNVFGPLIAYNLMQSLTMMERAADTFRRRCIKGVKADIQRCMQMVRSAPGLVTMLAPFIGYEKAATLVKKAGEEHRDIHEVVMESGLLPKEQVDYLLDPASMLRPMRKLAALGQDGQSLEQACAPEDGGQLNAKDGKSR
jgi:aspartate ammonia-lyase